MNAPFDKEDPNLNKLLFAAGVYLTLLLTLVAINPIWALAFFVFGNLVALVTLGIYYLRRIVEGTSLKSEESFSVRVSRRLLECQLQEDKFRDEANAIRKSFHELQDDLNRNTDVPAEEISRAEKIISALKAEFDLRHTKALFYADCATRLQQILDRHNLHESINQRQRELNRLQASYQDDTATVEETRLHLEQDSNQLDAIAAISKDVGNYFKADQAKELRERLENLRGKVLGNPQAKDENKS